MVRVRKNGGEVEIKDFLTKLYIRNGWEVVVEEKKETVTDEPKEVKQPKKRKTKK